MKIDETLHFLAKLRWEMVNFSQFRCNLGQNWWNVGNNREISVNFDWNWPFGNLNSHFYDKNGQIWVEKGQNWVKIEENLVKIVKSASISTEIDHFDISIFIFLRNCDEKLSISDEKMMRKGQFWSISVWFRCNFGGFDDFDIGQRKQWLNFSIFRVAVRLKDDEKW